MASDANAVLQSEVTKVADFNGAGVALGDTPRRGMYARVFYKNASAASGSATADVVLDVSYDSGSTWILAAARATTGTISIPAGSANATSGVIHIPFEFSRTDPTKPVQIRVTLDYTATSSPSAPGITYSSQLNLGRPD